MRILPKDIIKCFLFVILPIYGISLFSFPVYSDEISDIEKAIQEKTSQIEEKKNVLSTIENRIAEISSSNYSVTQKINLINEEITKLQESIDSTNSEIEIKAKEIEDTQNDLEKKKELLDSVSGDLYVQSRYSVSNFFLSLSDWDSMIASLFVKKNTISILKEEIERVSGEFSSLAEAKANLDAQKVALDAQKSDLASSYDLLAAEKSRLQKELNSQYTQKKYLSADITDLNAKVSQLQSALIAARSAGLVSTGGYTGTEEGTAISTAPSGYFGVFSIGAYTHRNGMSQWGARARAEAGQTYTQILSAYYPGKTIVSNTVNVNGTSEAIASAISVDGYGSLSLEDYYLMGIKEVPEDWPMEVLKAQAIAARTFAVNYTNNGRNSICTSQSCQVFNTPLKTGAWKQAVEETRGMILTNSDGTTASTQYAAVHGGWVNGGIWDTVSGNGDDWFNDAWEKKSGVTWFYKSWYKNGYTSDGESCGHSAWLSPEEMAIIVNAYLVKNSIGLKGTPDKSRILPSDYGNCSGRLDYGRSDKSPYTLNNYKSLLNSPVSAVYSANAVLSNGSTTSVVFNTDVGIITMTGFQFKDIYNQIAPGHMRIQQQSSYAYFNIEKR